MATKKSREVDRATATSTEPMISVDDKIAAARKHVTSMQQSAEWPKAPDVQKAAGDWSAATDDLEKNAQGIASLQEQLDTARSNELVLLRRWAAKRRVCIQAVNNYCDGSKDKVTNLGWGVLAKPGLPPAGVPQNFRALYDKVPVPGAIAVAWDPSPSRYGYMVQRATDPANAATFAEPVMVSKTIFKMTGQTRGATIYLRVLALDPKLSGGMSQYTPWLPVVVAA